MDTSEQYINMCRKAKELQDNHEWADGDFFAYKYKNEFIIDVVGTSSVISIDRVGFGWIEEMRTVEYVVWLPRIDQLIELLSADLRPTEGYTMIIKDRSRTEQELLMEYYVDEFHKKWNGDDWIKT